MIRVVFCLNGPDELNGPNVWLTRHLPLLRKKGIAAEILYLSWNPDRPCRFREQLVAAGVPVQMVHLSHFLEDNIEAILKPLSQDPPNVFVPNYALPAFFAARFLREAGVATVGVLHSDDPFYHDLVDIFVKGSPSWRLSGLVGVSQFLNECVAGGLEDEIPFLDAPYGAPIPAQFAASAKDRFRLLYCGRLVEQQKRIHRVADSMIAAAGEIPCCEGVIYGDGRERAALERYLLEACPDGRVTLGGVLEPEEIQNRMRDAQAFVLLSDFEGLSIALMEAMAVGLVPIVSRMRSGTEDLVEHGINGFVVDPENRADFVESVRTLASDAAIWREMSCAARETIANKGYSADQCAERWFGFVQTLSEGQDIGQVEIPAKWDLQLPVQGTRPNGVRFKDRRRVVQQITSAAEQDRPVFLWGASLAGETFYQSISECVAWVAGFVDSDASKHGTRFEGLEVFPPSYLVAMRKLGKHPFVVITSQFEAEIASMLYEADFAENVDYIAG